MDYAHAMSVARTVVLRAWVQAWQSPRYYYQLGELKFPFNARVTAAIDGGARKIKLDDNIDLEVDGLVGTIDGNPRALMSGTFEPVSVVFSIHTTSAHIDVPTTLDELEVLTGIEPCRWHIVVESGSALVSIAPSAAFVAPEIRQSPLHDALGLCLWLKKYDVKATPGRLKRVFGGVAQRLPPNAGSGSDETVLAAFESPVLIVATRRGASGASVVYRVQVRGDDSLASVLGRLHGTNDTAVAWHLHGVPLLPFADVGIWRCCTHGNRELHLYGGPTAGPAMKLVSTLYGVVSIPASASDGKPFVPLNVPSGNIFAERPLPRALDVAASVPLAVDRGWLQKVNAGQPVICLDHAVAIWRTFAYRFGAAALLHALVDMMAPQQGGYLLAVLKAKAVVHPIPMYVRYLYCIRDLLDGTHVAPPITLTADGVKYPMAPSVRWSTLKRAGMTLVSPTTLAAQLAMRQKDFILQELMSDDVVVARSPA